MHTKFKEVETHTLNPNQLSAGDDRRIHHGINKARDVIEAASGKNEGMGILDNDYKAAFDYMVLTWVLKVLKAKGLDMEVINMILNLYSNNLTVVVVNNVQGSCFPNTRSLFVKETGQVQYSSAMLLETESNSNLHLQLPFSIHIYRCLQVDSLH